MSTPESWDLEAVAFDDAADHGLHDPATREAWRNLLRGVLPPAPARVADLGCGTGTLSLLLAQEGYAVDGVDFSPEMVRRAVAKAGDLAHFVVGDAAEPPLGRGEYDVVLSRHVLWALPDPLAGLRRWVDLLAPGGSLVLVEGRWHTGAGLGAERCEELVRGVREEAVVRRLTDPALWGGPISDERYLLLSTR